MQEIEALAPRRRQEILETKDKLIVNGRVYCMSNDVNAASNYRTCNNVFDRSAHRILHLVAQKPESCPTLQGNTYLQHRGGWLGQYGANAQSEPPVLLFDEKAEAAIHQALGDEDAKVFFYEQD